MSMIRICRSLALCPFAMTKSSADSDYISDYTSVPAYWLTSDSLTQQRTCLAAERDALSGIVRYCLRLASLRSRSAAHEGRNLPHVHHLETARSHPSALQPAPNDLGRAQPHPHRGQAAS